MEKKITKEEDDLFHAQLLADLPYFHEVYAKYHNPQTLETIKNLEAYRATLKVKTYETTLS